MVAGIRRWGWRLLLLTAALVLLMLLDLAILSGIDTAQNETLGTASNYYLIGGCVVAAMPFLALHRWIKYRFKKSIPALLFLAFAPAMLGTAAILALIIFFVMNGLIDRDLESELREVKRVLTLDAQAGSRNKSSVDGEKVRVAQELAILIRAHPDYARLYYTLAMIYASRDADIAAELVLWTYDKLFINHPLHWISEVVSGRYAAASRYLYSTEGNSWDFDPYLMKVRKQYMRLQKSSPAGWLPDGTPEMEPRCPSLPNHARLFDAVANGALVLGSGEKIPLDDPDLRRVTGSLAGYLKSEHPDLFPDGQIAENPEHFRQAVTILRRVIGKQECVRWYHYGD